MLRFGRVISTLFIVFLVAAILLAGCSQRQVAEPPGQQPKEGPPTIVIEPVPVREEVKYYRPIDLYHLVANPLIINTSNHPDTTVSISGLKNKTVEDKVNTRLQELYISIKQATMPPYRGVRLVIPEGSHLMENRVHAEVAFNHNNVLSIIVSNHRSYSVPNKGYNSGVTRIETLNFDLYTGDEVTLASIFTDDVDYLGILSSVFNRKLRVQAGDDSSWFDEGPLAMAAPFRGIQASQKFHLFPGGVALVFDYETPEVATQQYPRTLMVYYNELGPMIALAQRFRADAPVFDSEPESKVLLRMAPSDGPQIVDDLMIGEVAVQIVVQYPGNVGPQARDRILDLANDYQGLVEELNDIDTKEYRHLGQQVIATQVGPYISVLHHLHLSVQQQYRKYSYCFDEEGRQLILDDLFVDGYAYHSIIKEFLTRALSSLSYKGQFSAEEIYEDLQFSLCEDAVYFSCSTIVSDQSKLPIEFTIHFTAFGCDNLTIFK